MTISDITSKIYFLTKTNSSSYLAADMLIAINNAYERVASLILQSDGRWQWDDTNQSDFPTATSNLVSSQQDYSLAASHLSIEGVSVKDKNGIWHGLEPIDPDDITSAYGRLSGDSAEYLKNPGMPRAYDKEGNSVILYPAPDNGVSVTLTAGLKVYFKRGPALYTSAEVSTGTKSPGFNSLYHDLIPLLVAYDFCVANGSPLAAGYMAEIQRKEAALVLDYSKRDKDERQVMTMEQINFR